MAKVSVITHTDAPTIPVQVWMHHDEAVEYAIRELQTTVASIDNDDLVVDVVLAEIEGGDSVVRVIDKNDGLEFEAMVISDQEIKYR